MGGPVCNTTLEDSFIHEDPVFHNLTYHHLGLILSAIFGLIAVVLSTYLIFMHATHYSRPYEQRHIIRIIFMVPVYSIISFLSFLFYRHAIYFQVVMECYEAFAIASFFTLICHYIAPNLHEQKEYFRALTPKPWILPVNWFAKCCGGQRGIWRTPRSGLTWFNIVWMGVFQYCAIRVFMTFTALITQVLGRYCEASLNPAFAHVWVMVIEASAVTVAMFCIFQFYFQLKPDIAPHGAFMKLLSIKLVIFVSFWQTIVISFLTSAHILKPSNKINYPDFKVGIPSMLLCIEMAIFSGLHLFAYSWKDYRLSGSTGPYADGSKPYKGGPLGMKAILDAYNPWDIIKAIGRSIRWMFVGRRNRLEDSSYKNHVQNADTATNSTFGIPPINLNPVYGAGAGAGAGAATAGPGGKMSPGKYAPDAGEEAQELLAHAQSNPVSNGLNRPPINPANSFNSGDSADLGDQGRWRHDDQLMASHPTPAAPQMYDPPPQDTSYHGAAPAPSVPTGPPAAQTGSNWNLWAGAAGSQQQPPAGRGQPWR